MPASVLHTHSQYCLKRFQPPGTIRPLLRLPRLRQGPGMVEKSSQQRDLFESERSFRLLVEGVADYALYMLDPTGRITSWNIGGERIKGYSTGEIIDHLSATRVPVTKPVTSEDALSRTLQNMTSAMAGRSRIPRGSPSSAIRCSQSCYRWWKRRAVRRRGRGIGARGSGMSPSHP